MKVDIEKFSDVMSDRWVNVLNNATSPALEGAWARMAEVFNQHILDKNNKPWSFLTLPTGTGKTQGLAMYCSMFDRNTHPGILIVTNFVKEAESLAKLINELSNDPNLARAKYCKTSKSTSDTNDAPTLDVYDTPVLIVTHVAYQNAMDAMSKKDFLKFKWDKINNWKGGERKLTVVDESIDIVKSVQITLEQLRLLANLNYSCAQ